MVPLITSAALIVFLISTLATVFIAISRERHRQRMELEASRRATKAIEAGTPEGKAEERLKEELLDIYNGVDTEN